MSPSQKSAFAPPENPSQPGSSEWTYNEIMRHIEPDLTTDVLPKHVEMYEKETPEQRVLRMKVYDEAFAVFDKAALDCEQEFFNDVQALKNQAHAEATKAEKQERKKELKNIEEEIDASEQ